MRWMQNEVAGVKEFLEEMSFEVREDRRNNTSTLAREELDIAGIKTSIEEMASDIVDIKENLEEMASEARQEQEKLNDLLEDLLSEIRGRE